MSKVDPKLELTTEHLPNGTLLLLKRQHVSTIGMLQILSEKEAGDIIDVGKKKLEDLRRCLASFQPQLRFRTPDENPVARVKDVFGDVKDTPVAYMYVRKLINYNAACKLEEIRATTYGALAQWRETNLAAMFDHDRERCFDAPMLERMRDELKRYGLSFK